jgi:NAD(P)-dependent dehydrogenase (short-subunit alcohol dehydrogenase family)
VDELRFEGRVAIVTGGGRGLGESHARYLAARGARVVINDSGTSVTGHGRDDQVAEKVAASIRAQGGQATAHSGDIGDPEVCREVVELALGQYGALDIVIHNAAIERLAPLADVRRQDILDTLEPDALSAVTLAQLAWPVFESRQYGRLVLTSSTAYFGSKLGFPYGISKSAIVGLGRSLDQLARTTDADIKVNVIAPHGLSRMVRQVYAGFSDPQKLAIREKYAPSHYTSAVVALLAHEACPTAGDLLQCAAGGIRRLFIGASEGWDDPDLTPERLLANWSSVDRLGDWQLIEGGSTENFDEYFARLLRSRNAPEAGPAAGIGPGSG